MSSRTALRWMWLLAGLHLAWLGLRYGLGFPIWGDEAFVAVNFFERSYLDLIQPLEYGQIGPLFWVWAEKACFDLLGASPYALRLPAFLAGVGTTLLMLRLMRRALPPTPALLAFAIFAASYYPLRHAAELKPYSIDLLFAVAMLNLAYDLRSGLCAGRPEIRRWLALTGLSLLGVWSSFPSLFVSGGLLLFFLYGALFRPARSGRERFARFLPPAIWGLWLAIGALTMIRIHAGPHAAAASWLTEMAMWKPTFPPVAEPWRIPGWLVEIHAGYMSAYPTGGRHFGSSGTLLLILLGGFALARSERRYLLGLLLLPLLFNFAAAAMERYPYGGSVRVSIFMAPAFCLMAGLGLHRLTAWASSRWQLGLAHSWCVVLAAFLVLGGVRDLKQPYKSISDQRSLEFAAFLADSLDADDVITGFCNTERGYLPAFHGLGGSMARLRFHLLRDLDHPVLWGGAISALALSRGGNMPGHFWLIAYTDDNDADMPFPEGEFHQLLQELTFERGPAAHFEFPFRNAERIDLYRFAPRETP